MSQRPNQRAPHSWRLARQGSSYLSFADIGKNRTTLMPAKRITMAALLCCCLLFRATSAQAAIIAHTRLINDPSAGLPFANDPAGTIDSSVGAPWVSYRLFLTATGGD